MTIRLPARALILASTLACLAPAPARAGLCAVSAQSLPFGEITGGGAQVVSAVTVTCPPGLPTQYIGLCVKIQNGGGGRKMMNAAGQSISYGIYHDSASSRPWLDATSEMEFVSAPYDPSRTGTLQQTLYATTPPAAGGASAGVYTEAVGVQAVVAGENGYDGASNVCNGVNAPIQPLAVMASATVKLSCIVGSTDLRFLGTPSPTMTVHGAATLTISCTGGDTPFQLALSAGRGAGATTAARMMTGSNNAAILYSLYKDLAHQQLWGDDDSSRYSGATSKGFGQATIYGFVPTQPTPVPGVYTDTISVTLTY